MRRLLSTVLVVLVALLTPLSAVAVWGDREIGDTDRFVATMAPLSSDPAVRNAVAERVTDEVLKNVDVGPFQDSVRGFVRQAVTSFTDSAAFRTAWDAVNREGHSALDRSLSSDSDEPVTLDLAPVTQQVKDQLVADGQPFAQAIPVTHTRITVVEPEKLGGLRTTFRWLRVGGVWLPVATVVLTLAALVLSVRRARTLAGLGLAFAVGGALLRAGVAVARATTLGDLPSDVDPAAARAVYDQLTATLSTTAWVLLGAGAVLAVAGWFTDRSRRGRTVAPGRPPAPREAARQARS
ncbi:hypothetical protein ABT160_19755 [Streptomyces sp. NPDC001941]|uniref:hypothetical protein n=1 Tax=Streptomyces sp. NPDC001941 TaxID=3154659 RepID=UPI0033345392